MTSKRKTKPNGAIPMTQTTPVTPVTDVPVVETPVVVPTTVPEEPVVVDTPVTDAVADAGIDEAPVTDAPADVVDAPLEVVTIVADVVEPPVAVAPVVEVDDIYNFLKKKYGGIAVLPLHVQGIIEKLDVYVKTMGDNVPVTEEAGTRNQLNLFRVYSAALDVPNGGHVLALDVIVWYVSKYRDGAFSDRLAARFLNTTAFPPDRQRMFVSLTNLFTVLANPLTRRELNKHVNMDVVARNLPSIAQRRNLVSFVSK
jgi:hypothetical protein